MAKLSIQSTKTLFVSKRTNSLIVLQYVARTQWSEHIDPELYVYFNNSSYAVLPSEEANDFLVALLAFHQ